MSNGQKQRTALARALVADPDILLLDDPLRNVDAKLRYEMRLELPALLKRAGSTVLYVTQDFKEAMALGDRIAVLLDGQIAQCDTPARIYAEPASVGVARLFGDPTLNLVDVEPRLVDGAPEVLVGGAPIRLPATYAAAAGGSYMLGLRPEALRLSRGQCAGNHRRRSGGGDAAERKVRASAYHRKPEASCSPRKPEIVTIPRRAGPGRIALDLDAVLLFDRAQRQAVRPHRR